MWSFKNGCAELFETQADKKCPFIFFVFVCFDDAVVTWPYDVIAVSNWLDINVIHPYLQLVLHRHICWHATCTIGAVISIAGHKYWHILYILWIALKQSPRKLKESRRILSSGGQGIFQKLWLLIFDGFLDTISGAAVEVKLVNNKYMSIYHKVKMRI